MEIIKNGTQASVKGPEDWFTGEVRIDPLFLIVISGLGWVQREGDPIEEIYPGDVVWFEPEEKHWHGASPNKAMSHIAIQEEKNGKVVEWMEKVTDEQYKHSND